MASSLFSKYDKSTPLSYEVLPTKNYPVSIGVVSGKKKCAVGSGPSSDAALRRIRGKEARAKAKRGKCDPRSERTVFIGNIPNSCNRKDVKNLLKSYGTIDSIRLRSIKVTEGERPARVARRTQKQIVENSTFNAYVVFSSSIEAESCLDLNGTLLQGRHIRVDWVEKKSINPTENQHSVFVGNLPFDADEEKMRDVFSSCGDIESIRLVRDSKSGIGKGFGFILFADRSGVLFACRQTKKLEMNGRLLRVTRCRSQQQQQKVHTKVKKKVGKRLLQKTKSSKIVLNSSVGTVTKLVATKFTGKRKPDGTKNRLYRLPSKSSD